MHTVETVMSNTDGITQDLDIRDLGAKGCEIIVTVVNVLEAPLFIRGGHVEVFKDEKNLGEHRLSFDRHDGLIVELDQFMIAHGRFHLAPEGGIHDLHCIVHLDCSRGDGVETKRISRRMKTGIIRKPG